MMSGRCYTAFVPASRRTIMAERTRGEGTRIERPARAEVSARGALEKMRKFAERREKFVAAIRKNKD